MNNLILPKNSLSARKFT